MSEDKDIKLVCRLWDYQTNSSIKAPFGEKIATLFKELHFTTGRGHVISELSFIDSNYAIMVFYFSASKRDTINLFIYHVLRELGELEKDYKFPNHDELVNELSKLEPGDVVEIFAEFDVDTNLGMRNNYMHIEIMRDDIEIYDKTLVNIQTELTGEVPEYGISMIKI